MEPSRRERAASAYLEKRSDLEAQTQIGPPCTKCRWKDYKQEFRNGRGEMVLYCAAPPAQEHTVDRTTGTVIARTVLSAEAARSDDGLCGPEAEMFQDRWTRGRYIGIAVAVGYGLLTLTNHWY